MQDPDVRREDKDEASGCFRGKLPGEGVRQAGGKKIPVSWFGNWVDGMPSIKIGTPGRRSRAGWGRERVHFWGS